MSDAKMKSPTKERSWSAGMGLLKRRKSQSVFQEPQSPVTRLDANFVRTHGAPDTHKLKFPLVLDFSHQNFQLEDIDGVVENFNPAAVKELNLTHNRLSMVGSMEEFSRLEVLCLRSNRLTGATIVAERITKLDLSHNHFESLPDLSGMPLLQSVTLSHNKMEGSLERIAGLKRLQNVHLAYNQFQWKQKEFEGAVSEVARLPMIKEVSMEGSPFCAWVSNYREVVLSNLPKLLMLDSVSMDIWRSDRQRRPAPPLARGSIGGGTEARLFGDDDARSEMSDTSSLGSFATGVSLQQRFTEVEMFKLPVIVVRAVEYLESRGKDVEGIFREGRDPDQVRRVKRAFEKGKLSTFNACGDPHLIASVLKDYLRELSGPLLTFEAYDEFIESVRNVRDHSTRKNVVRGLVAKLPVENYRLVSYICEFLHRVSNNSQANRMSSVELATVFGPLFLRTKRAGVNALVKDASTIHKIAGTLIDDPEYVFQANEEEDNTNDDVREVMDAEAPLRDWQVNSMNMEDDRTSKLAKKKDKWKQRSDLLRSELEERDQRVRSLSTDVERYRGESESLTKMVKVTESSIKEYKTEIEQLKARLESMEDDVRSEKLVADRERNAADELRAEIDQIRQEEEQEAKMQAEALEKADQENVSLRKKIKEMQRQLDEYGAERETWEVSVSQMEQKMEDAEQRSADAEEALQRRLGEMETLRFEANLLQGEVDDRDVRIGSLMEEADAARKRLEDSEKALRNERMENQDLNQSLHNMREKIKEAEEASKSHGQELSAAQAAVTDSNAVAASRERQLADAESRLKKVSKEKDNAVGDNKKLQSKLGKLQDELEESQREAREFKSTLEENEARNSAKMEALKRSLEDARADAAKQKDAVKAARQECKKLEETVSIQKKALDKREKTAAAAGTQKADTDKLKRRLDEANNALESLKHEAQKKEHKMEAAIAELNSARSQVQTKEEELVALRLKAADMNETKIRVEELEASMRNLERAKADGEMKLVEERTEAQTSRADAERKCQSLADEVRVLKDELGRSKYREEMARDELKEKDTLLNASRGEVVSAGKQFAESTAEYKAKVSELTLALESREESIARLQDEAQNHARQINEMSQEVGYYKRTLDEVKKGSPSGDSRAQYHEIEALKSAEHQLRLELLEAKHAMDKAIEGKKYVDKENMDLAAKVRRLESQVEELHTQLAGRGDIDTETAKRMREREEQWEDMEDMLEDTKIKLDMKKQETVTLRQVAEKFSVHVVKLQEDNEKKSQELGFYKAKVTAMERELNRLRGGRPADPAATSKSSPGFTMEVRSKTLAEGLGQEPTPSPVAPSTPTGRGNVAALRTELEKTFDPSRLAADPRRSSGPARTTHSPSSTASPGPDKPRAGRPLFRKGNSNPGSNQNSDDEQ